MAWNGLMCLIIPNKHYLGFFFENNQFISVVLCIFFLKFSYGNIVVISNKILMVISNLPTVNDFSWRLLFICWWIIWKKSFLSIEFFFVVFIACDYLNFLKFYPFTVYRFKETLVIGSIPFPSIYLSSCLKKME